MSCHEITKLYFNKQNNEPNEFICRCGKRRKQDPKTRALSMSLVEQNASHQSLKFVKPTSNMIERFFFSGAKFFLGQHRYAITPEHFESQLFLQANRRFWDIETVHEFIA